MLHLKRPLTKTKAQQSLPTLPLQPIPPAAKGFAGLDKALKEGFRPGVPTPLFAIPGTGGVGQTYQYRNDAGELVTERITIGGKSTIGLQRYLARKAAGVVVVPLECEGRDWA